MQKAILVVDDDPIALQLFNVILSEWGFSVITFEDGRSALQAIQEGARVDLVITDYRMPGMDGLELVERLKRDMPHIPAIMCSVHMRANVYLKALSLGVVEYLEKPVSEKVLKRVVTTALDATAREREQATEREGNLKT